MNSRMFVSAITLTLMVGCKANKDSLDTFYTDAKRSGHKEVEVLANVVPFEVEVYAQSEARSPLDRKSVV